jgi:hypothetical protein
MTLIDQAREAACAAVVEMALAAEQPAPDEAVVYMAADAAANVVLENTPETVLIDGDLWVPAARLVAAQQRYAILQTAAATAWVSWRSKSKTTIQDMDTLKVVLRDE